MRPDDNEGLTLPALLDLLEEPAPGTPMSSTGASIASAADAAAPRVEAAAREAATAAGVAVLLVLVPLAALLVVTVEKTATAIADADLPGRGRAVAARVPRWVEQWRAWSQRGAQWVLGPQGLWSAASRELSSRGSRGSSDRWRGPTLSAGS